MKRTLMLLLALSFVAVAQTGVELSGDYRTPQLTNQTGKPVVCVVVKTVTAGKAAYNTMWLVNKPIPPDGAAHSLVAQTYYGGGAPDQVVIDGVVFADGSFDGPDTGNSFAILGNQLSTIVSTAKVLTTGSSNAWDHLQAMASATVGGAGISREQIASAYAQRLAAMLIVQTRAASGDTAAQSLATAFASLGMLHR